MKCPCKLKLNQKQKRLYYIIIEFFFRGPNLLLQDWKFSNKNFSRYVKNPFSCRISFQIRMCKFVKKIHSFRYTKGSHEPHLIAVIKCNLIN